MPRMDIAPLRAAGAAPSVRFAHPLRRRRRAAALFRRADLVVLPYREIEQSGVAFTALAFGLPLLLSDVGGFPEVAETGAARIVAAGDAGALAAALRELLADPARARARWPRARRARRRRSLLLGRDRRGTLALYERCSTAELARRRSRRDERP